MRGISYLFWMTYVPPKERNIPQGMRKNIEEGNEQISVLGQEWLVVSQFDFAEFTFVIPAKAGIQEYSALASG